MKGWSRNKQAGANLGKQKMNRIALVSLMGLALMLVVIATAAGAGVSMRASTDSSGAQANYSSSQGAISPDGRFVSFYSWADNLVPGDTNGTIDIFLKNLEDGSTALVSTGSAGEQGNQQSAGQDVSSNGLYVVFASQASNLVPGDTNSVEDVFVKNMADGTTTRVSVSSAGEQGNSSSGYSYIPPVISADGRYVAFRSYASNLAPGDTNGKSDIFVRDTIDNITTRISTDSAGGEGNGNASNPSISDDGRYIAFSTVATNMVTSGDSNGAQDVFVKDTQTGRTMMVSTDGVGNQGNKWSDSPSITADGSLVAFYGGATNLVPGDTNAVNDVFVKEVKWDGSPSTSGRSNGQIIRVSTDASGGQASSWSSYPSISDDGRYVAFHSNDLVPDDESGICYPPDEESGEIYCDGTSDVYVKDVQSGQITLASTNEAGVDADNYSYPSSNAISADGKYVAFSSYATNLVAGDTNGVIDVFVSETGFGAPTDTTAPTVSNIQPTGTLGTSSATVSAYFSDADPSSGIDASSASLTVSGGTVSDCVATAAGITCNASGLADGEHTINVTVADSAGNTGTGTGSFTVDTCQPVKPALGLANTGAYWDGYADYQARLLTVSYSISNTGPGDAYGIGLVGAVNTMGVTTATGIPGPLGNAATGTSLSAGVKYQVPAGVGAFKSSIYATAADACGETYSYPGPVPET